MGCKCKKGESYNVKLEHKVFSYSDQRNNGPTACKEEQRYIKSLLEESCNSHVLVCADCGEKI